MSDPASHHRAVRIRGLLIDLSVMVAIGLGLALLGPFGSYAESFPRRLVYWMTLSIAGYFCYFPIAGLVVRKAREIQFPTPLAWVFAVLIATVPMTAIVWSVAHVLGGVPVPDFPVAAEMYGHVLIIGAMVTVVFHLLEGRFSLASPAMENAREPNADQPTATTRTAPFLDRLPAELGTDLIALEMEDHYVRAHTALGTDLVLMRMRDAVAELSGVEGRQVHRSWWVARGAVEDIRREGRNIRLVLAGGLEAPVARTQVSELKAAGWI
ncbi:LytTR family DNA-binding domain-containing protein [Qipengyuania nanhaisediminis]|uniref:LytTR family DNA-binding domain-containing protein n=1 Tax=Qipengyuania nanhaisediminis TaxID=604088 RepID=UPI0038B2805E